MSEGLLCLKPYKYFASWVIFAEPLSFFIWFSIGYIALHIRGAGDSVVGIATGYELDD
jgi:hypothetical protein